MKKYIIFFILLSVLSGLILYLYGKGIIQNELKTALLVETYGSGLLAFIIAITLDYLEEQAVLRAEKKRLERFYENYLFTDLRVLFTRQTSAWNPQYGNIKFYFDNSYCNPIFDDICIKYRQDINEYSRIFINEILTKLLIDFSRHMSKSLTLAEKLESQIISIARKEHHKLGIIQANDLDLVYYLKSKFFANLSNKTILLGIDRQSIPRGYLKILKELKQNKVINKVKGNLIKERRSVIKISEDIKKYIEDNDKNKKLFQ